MRGAANAIRQKTDPNDRPPACVWVEGVGWVHWKRVPDKGHVARCKCGIVMAYRQQRHECQL